MTTTKGALMLAEAALGLVGQTVAFTCYDAPQPGGRCNECSHCLNYVAFEAVQEVLIRDYGFTREGTLLYPPRAAAATGRRERGVSRRERKQESALEIVDRLMVDECRKPMRAPNGGAVGACFHPRADHRHGGCRTCSFIKLSPAIHEFLDRKELP